MEKETENLDTAPKLDYMEKMWDLVESLGEDLSNENLIERLTKNKDKLKEINDYVTKLPLYTKSKEEHDKFLATIKADVEKPEARIKTAWGYFVLKSNRAPTQFHLIGVVILIMPIIYLLVTEYEAAQTQPEIKQ